MNAIDFILSQSRFYPRPRTSSIMPPGGGKLDAHQTAEVRERRLAGEKLAVLAREYGISVQAVFYIANKGKKQVSRPLSVTGKP